MFSLAKHKRAFALLASVMASMALGATQDDELRVDPTVPLGMAFSAGDAASDSGSLDVGSMFDIFGGIGDAFTSYELSSVLIRAQDRIAIINEERVRVGDKVGSAVVASIEADHVTLNVDGEIETVKLYENSIKTRVKGDER